MTRLLWSLLSFAGTLALWKLVAESGFIQPALFPSPGDAAEALWGLLKNGTLLVDLRDSLARVAAGLALGSVAGIITGIVTGRLQIADAMLSPLIQTVRALPPVAIIPLVIVWLGIGDTAKIFSIAFAVFFPVWLNTYLGTKRIAPEHLWSAQLLTQSATKVLRRVIFPAALPFITAGVRIGISVAFVMVFVSELAGASTGLGYRISITQLAYRIDEMMAVLLVLTILGALTDQGFVYLTRRIFPWLKFSTV